MPPPRIWTPADDTLIVTRRAAKASWDDLARELGCSRWTVIEYARKSGLTVERARSMTQAPAEEPHWHDDPNREPLPPGHDISWGAIANSPWMEMI
jgi:hypothetical protein